MSSFKNSKSINPRVLRFEFSNAIFGTLRNEEVLDKVRSLCKPDVPISINIRRAGPRRFVFVEFETGEAAGATLHYYMEHEDVPVVAAFKQTEREESPKREMSPVPVSPKGDSPKPESPGAGDETATGSWADDSTPDAEAGDSEGDHTFVDELAQRCHLPNDSALAIDNNLAAMHAIFSWEALSAAVEYSLLNTTHIPVGVLAMVKKSQSLEK